MRFVWLLLALAICGLLAAGFVVSLPGEKYRIECTVTMTVSGVGRKAYVRCPDDPESHATKLPRGGLEIGQAVECTETRRRIPFTRIQPELLRRFKDCTLSD